MYLGNDRHGWKIYDPLLNPELIFELQEYEQEIKPLFLSVVNPKRPFELIIEEQTLTQCSNQMRKTRVFFKNAPAATVSALKVDQNYADFLIEKQISDPDYKKTTDAYHQLSAIFGWNSILPSSKKM